MPAAFLERTVFRLRFAGLLTRSQGMSPSRPSFRKDSGCKCFDTPFCGSSQQRDCPGFAPDSLFIRRPGRTDAEQNVAKIDYFSERRKPFPAFFTATMSARADSEGRIRRLPRARAAVSASTSNGIREHERRYPRTDTAISLPESSKKADFAAPYIRLFRRKSLLL